MAFETVNLHNFTPLNKSSSLLIFFYFM